MTIDTNAIRKRGADRADIPTLFAEIDRLRAENERQAAELEKERARATDLANRLHRAEAEIASHNKAVTAWANEAAAKDKVIEAAKAWVHADVADFGRTGAALTDAVANLPQRAEQRCPNCAPGYDCERGTYTKAEVA